MAGVGEGVLVVLALVAFFVLLAAAGTMVTRLVAMRWPVWLIAFMGLCATLVGSAVGNQTVRQLGCGAAVCALGAGTLAWMVRKKRR